jgi:hypothetical protein
MERKKIRIAPVIKVDNRFYIPLEAKAYFTTVVQFSYYNYIISRPEFYRKMFPQQRLLIWGKKINPSKAEHKSNKIIFSHKTKSSEPSPTKQNQKRRMNYRDKFRCSIPLPEKEEVITLYSMTLKEKIPSFRQAKFMKTFRNGIIYLMHTLT